MSHWPKEQRAFAVEQYLKNNESLVLARRAFCAHYNIRRPKEAPSPQLIKVWVKKFRQEGTVATKPPKGPTPWASTPEHAALVWNEIQQDPKNSLRQIAASTGLSKSTVHAILKKRIHVPPVHKAVKNADTKRRKSKRNSQKQCNTEDQEASNHDDDINSEHNL